MTYKKIWTLFKPDANRTDATYIVGLGCEVEVVLPKEFIGPNGTRWQMRHEQPYIEIATTCEKQESMLYLKYGDRLRLKQSSR